MIDSTNLNTYNCLEEMMTDRHWCVFKVAIIGVSNNYIHLVGESYIGYKAV